MKMAMTEKLVTVGMNAIDLTQALFVTHSMLLIEFVVYQCEEKPHFAEAKKKNPKARRNVAEALQHTSDFEEPHHYFVQRIADFDKIRSKIDNLKRIEPETTAIASYVGPEEKNLIYVHEAMKFISKVRTRNGIFHVPLLDLDIPTDEIPSDVVFPYIKEVSRCLGVDSGAIINSGKSYHLWGLELISKDDWEKFMHDALLLDRIDRRWIGHRLKDGHANLRVSPKWGKMPKVAYVF